MKTAHTVGIVIIQNNKVLLVREGESSGHMTGVYNTPAGRIEEGETPEQAAIRELKEESGLDTKVEDLVKLAKEYTADIQRKNGEIMRFYHKVFVCKKYSGTLQSSDDVSPEWIQLKDVHSLRLLPNIDNMIEEAQKVL